MKLKSWTCNFNHFHQISPCTRGCLVDTCIGQHNMQEDTSSSLIDLLNGGTILMDVCKIQVLNRYFKKFRDKFGWFVKIQGRSWVITHYLGVLLNIMWLIIFWFLCGLKICLIENTIIKIRLYFIPKNINMFSLFSF